MGETIHQQAINSQYCPIQALARRVHHIITHNGDGNTLICDVYHNSIWTSIDSKQIITLICSACTNLNLHKRGIDPDLVGAHSLRAGGAMALKLHGFHDTVIMKMGRWTSMTFLQYIHNQIAHLQQDISKKMSMPLPFLNIAAIEQQA